MAESIEEHTHKIGNVAKMMDMTVPGIRIWAEKYHTYLSPYANPGKYGNPGKDGGTRRFTNEDIELFQRIAKMKSDDGGMTHADILIRLSIEKPKVDSTPEQPQDATGAPQTAIASSVDANTLAPLIQALVANQVSAEQVQAMAEQVQTLADASQIKAERIAIVEDRTKSQAGQMQQQQYLMYGILIAVLLVLIMMVVLVMVLR
jgi:DNA-binding transcriptional MerR regulator